MLSVKLTAVTSPYKEKIIQYLDECSLEVQELQAVNTVILKNNKLYGYNTDIFGINFALQNIDLYNKSIAILGAGGAARAIGYVLSRHAVQLFWINRTPSKALQLSQEFGGNVIAISKLSEIKIDIIVNTTTIGMYPNINESPLPNYKFSKHQVVFDMIYNPYMTKLLQQARHDQAQIISGIDMFISQGLKQIELFIESAIDIAEIIDQLRIIIIKNQESLNNS